MNSPFRLAADTLTAVSVQHLLYSHTTISHREEKDGHVQPGYVE